MPYKVDFSKAIKPSDKVAFPISMNQALQNGPRLAAMIQKLKETQCDLTIIVCDYLNRFNIGEEKAKELGQKFRNNHVTILDGLKVLGWKDFLDQRKEPMLENYKKIMRDSQPGSQFYKKMIKTYKNCFSSQDSQSSIAYQREEYAGVLSMTEFDILIYPVLTPGLSELYATYPNEKKPEFVSIRIKHIKEDSVSLFANKNPRDSLPLPLRIAYQNLEELLNSDEISSAKKQIFAEKVQSLINAKISPDMSPENSPPNSPGDKFQQPVTQRVQVI